MRHCVWQATSLSLIHIYSQGRLTVELYGEGIDDIMKQGDGFSAGLSALLGVTLTAPEKKKGSQGIHVEMHERAPYRACLLYTSRCV